MYPGERLNGYTHLAGALLAVIGAGVLVTMAGRGGDVWKVVSVAVYGTTLVMLYSFSTLYHSVRGRAKRVLRKFDHAGIYLLIAGTYTPFTLVSLRGPWGWSLFGTVWGLALIGILQEFWLGKGARVLSLVIYLLTGWVGLVAAAPLVEALTPAGFAWVAAGGAIYTAGIVFYLFDERFRHWHGIWHLFVLGGSAAHYLAILFYVV